MTFFANDAVNRVNLHYGVQALAQGAGGLFLFVLLLKAGLSPTQALLAQAAIVAGRFVLRPLLTPLAVRFGLKPLMIGGGLAVAAQYPLLAEVGRVGSALAALIIAASGAETLYYVASNSYFAAMGDAQHRGRQVGVAQAATAVAGVLAPLAGAWALTSVGPRGMLWAVAAVQMASVLPLVGAPNVRGRPEAPGAFRAARQAAVLIALDGWFDTAWIFAWQIALFLSLGRSVAAYGGAMALAGLVGGAFALLVGRNVDLGGGRRAVVIGYGAAAAVVILRAASLGVPWLAVAANAAGAFALPLMIPPLVTATHNRAKAGPCPFRFMIATEGAWDLGCFAACLTSAALLAGGAPLWAPVLLGLPAAFGGAAQLWRMFPPSASG